MSAVYGSRPIRSRRSEAEMDELRAAIRRVVAEIQPATVRQIFYQLVSRGIIAKTEAAYKNTVVRLLAAMRRSGEVPFSWIADNTRWMRKPASYSSLTEMLSESQRLYRRALWDSQDAYVEIWLEKDALSGVLYDVTSEYDVPLMVTRGYASLSYLHGAADAILRKRKPAFLYYFGDHDPSGCDITRAVESGIREFAPRAEIHFDRVAVTKEQILKWSLPARPTKRSDSRSAGFEGDSVEVDSIPPAMLRKLVRQCIEPHQMAVSRAIENEERETLDRLIGIVRRAA